MTLTLKLTPEQEERLAREAAMRGLSVEEYAMQKLANPAPASTQGKYAAGDQNGTPSTLANGGDSIDQLEAWFQSINDPSVPPIPLEYLSREVMYEGRGEVCSDPECETCANSE